MHRTGSILILILALAFSGPATAAPLQIKNGSTVRVAVAGGHERGIGLRGQGAAWRLELAGGALIADLYDVTPGVAPTKWTVPVVAGALVLEAPRFVAGHAYRVRLRHGLDAMGGALIYLYPAHTSGNQRVNFDDAPPPAADRSDEIAITPKSDL